ncbi:alpha/beta fold hydrolase [Massilia sp. W12]|uniref:thioesterase II family protein n=1 Tax=Massilia sp. W12 TaxID=3126507 RepID=UPI0030D42380
MSIHLFGVSYAGGSAAATYGRWSRLLPATIKVHALELPGHGRRMAEPFAASLEMAVTDLLRQLEAALGAEQNWAVYGHSMGATLCYELVKAAAAAGLPAPQAMFLSGRNPPHYAYPQRNLHLLDDESFLDEIKKLGGTPVDFFQMKSLLQAFLPILRNDYRIIELYRQSLPIHITPADIVFFASNQDVLVKREEALEWERYTSATFAIHDFPGGHFFINEQQEAICRIISQSLSPHISAHKLPSSTLSWA